MTFRLWRFFFISYPEWHSVASYPEQNKIVSTTMITMATTSGSSFIWYFSCTVCCARFGCIFPSRSCPWLPILSPFILDSLAYLSPSSRNYFMDIFCFASIATQITQLLIWINGFAWTTSSLHCKGQSNDLVTVEMCNDSLISGKKKKPLFITDYKPAPQQMHLAFTALSLLLTSCDSIVISRQKMIPWQSAS